MGVIVDANNVLEFYEENGYVGGLSVLGGNEVSKLQEGFAQFEKQIGKADSQYSLHNVHLNEEWVMRLAAHPRMLEPLRAVLGPNIILLDSRFICKYPDSEMPRADGSKAYVAWHQDIRYWGVDGRVVTVWLAVDDADIENAVMFVIPGTHKIGIVKHQSAALKGNLLTMNQEIPAELYDTTQAVPCPLKAGEMSIHDGLVIHGSEPNMSKRRRCGFVIRYISTTTKPITDDPDKPRTFPATVLVTGSGNESMFKDNAPEWFKRDSQ